jgi:hypothetical protein
MLEQYAVPQLRNDLYLQQDGTMSHFDSTSNEILEQTEHSSVLAWLTKPNTPDFIIRTHEEHHLTRDSTRPSDTATFLHNGDCNSDSYYA